MNEYHRMNIIKQLLQKRLMKDVLLRRTFCIGVLYVLKIGLFVEDEVL